MCHPFNSADCTPSAVDRLKLLDDPPSFMKFPEPQPVLPFALLIGKRDRKPPSMVSGVRRSRAHRKGNPDGARFGVPLKQHPACIALVKCSLNEQH